ncbi:MAG: hypothetical protein ACO248_12345, partial [Burkholderiaceae bacterium]
MSSVDALSGRGTAVIELHSTRVPASADALQAAWQALGSDPVSGPPGTHLGIVAGVRFIVTTPGPRAHGPRRQRDAQQQKDEKS